MGFLIKEKQPSIRLLSGGFKEFWKVPKVSPRPAKLIWKVTGAIPALELVFQGT